MEVDMTGYHAVLILAAFFCSLVAGFLFAFAAVVMPGIRSLDDGAFIRAFQAIDAVIQNNQPLFLIAWVGSTPALLAAAVLGAWALDGADRVLMMLTAAVYILCVQLPTFAINIPLNNALQKLDPGAMTEPARSRARDAFEARWNRWNTFRTGCASATSFALMLLLLRA
jgi:uncharacterized membrane protein